MKHTPVRVFSLLFLLFVIPLMIAAYFVYWGSWPGAQINRGHLFQPAVAVGDLPWKKVDGKPFLWKNNAQNKWVMLYVLPLPCDEQCHQVIYQLHQIQIALNQDQAQFVRVLAFPFSAKSSDITRIYQDNYAKDMLSVELSRALLEKKLGHLVEDYPVLILDPEQRVVLGYERTARPGDILKDLQRLMRAFHLGQNKT